MLRHQKIPAFLSIDVEPDEFQLSYRDKPPWSGFVDMLKIVQQLRDDLKKLSNHTPVFGWYLRTDTQIGEVYGRTDFVFHEYRDQIRQVTARGDYLGVHAHPVRWCQQRQQWVHEFGNAGWLARHTRMALDAFDRGCGASAKRYRAGAGFLVNAIIEAIDQSGVLVDLTLEPVAGWGLTVKEVNSGTDCSPIVGSYTNCRSAPRFVYQPDPQEFRKAGEANRRELVMIPLSTYSDLPPQITTLRPAWWQSWLPGGKKKQSDSPSEAKVLYPSVPWQSPAVFWDTLERELALMERPYVSLGIRTDNKNSPQAQMVQSILAELPRHALGKRLEFVDPLDAMSELMPPPPEPQTAIASITTRQKKTARWVEPHDEFPCGKYEPPAPLQVEPATQLIAFYLPQFHPIPENDRWWGKGFTEWTNVTAAKPLFEGHHQPRLPGDLGFYDLRVPEVMQQQVEMARRFGIGGFCFHYYWFHGKRLLEKPLDMFLDHPEWDLPFCLCWANENWSRRWDGGSQQVLIAQQHSAADDLACIEDLKRYMRDPRYIRINGRPLVIVYRVSILPEPQATAQRWRDACRAAGLGEILLVAAQSFDVTDPRPYGFDAAVQFPPHGSSQNPSDTLPQQHTPFYGRLHDYPQMVRDTKPPDASYRTFRTVFPAWDNTPRLKGGANIFHNSTPGAYARWLTAAIQDTAARNPADEQLVFINAWNEWAEGAYLEPDAKWGYAYLNATARVLEETAQENATAAKSAAGATR